MSSLHRFDNKVQSVGSDSAPTLVVLLEDRQPSLGVCEQVCLPSTAKSDLLD
jgi:DsbC/DsbD-like thiol-disulfide interchange protein